MEARNKMAIDQQTKPLPELIHDLSPELQAEVRQFVESLLNRREIQPKRKLRQDWANAVTENEYSSVELQHMALQWRAKSCTF